MRNPEGTALTKVAIMIVQPDFPEHWKTRRLVEITGDESAPMAVLRLWSHCQHSKRSTFPEMTAAQLASICHWGSRKPACSVSLIKAGFVDKLGPKKGFAAHDWNTHNNQLIQKWEAGRKGGRPPNEFCGKNENFPKTVENQQIPTHESDTLSTDKTGGSEQPIANRPLTGMKPDQIRADQIRSDRMGGNHPPKLFPREIDSQLTDLKAELRKVDPSDISNWEPMLAKIHNLEIQKFGVARTKPPKPRPQPTLGRNSFAETPLETMKKFVNDTMAEIDTPKLNIP